MGVFASWSTVDLAPMPDAEDQDEQGLIADGVDDPVVAHADAVRILRPRQPDDSRGRGFPASAANFDWMRWRASGCRASMAFATRSNTTT